MNTPERFFLDQDDDCHWYIVAANKRHEWLNLPDDDEASWEPPTFARGIDGPNGVSFENPDLT